MEVAQALVSIGLGRYAQRFKELGITDLAFLRSLDEQSLQTLADEVPMAPGHKLKFVKLIGSEPCVGQTGYADDARVVWTPCGGLAREHLEWLEGTDCNTGPYHIAEPLQESPAAKDCGRASPGAGVPAALRAPEDAALVAPESVNAQHASPRQMSLDRVISQETVQCTLEAEVCNSTKAHGVDTAVLSSGPQPCAAPMLPTLLTSKVHSHQAFSEPKTPTDIKESHARSVAALTPMELPAEVNLKVCGQWALEASVNATRWAMENSREPRQWALEASHRAGVRALVASRDAGHQAVEAGALLARCAWAASGDLARHALAAAGCSARAGAAAARSSSRHIDIALNSFLDGLHERMLRLDAGSSEGTGEDAVESSIARGSSPVLGHGHSLDVHGVCEPGSMQPGVALLPPYVLKQQLKQHVAPQMAYLLGGQQGPPPAVVSKYQAPVVVHPGPSRGQSFSYSAAAAVHAVQAPPRFVSSPVCYPVVQPCVYAQASNQQPRRGP